MWVIIVIIIITIITVLWVPLKLYFASISMVWEKHKQSQSVFSACRRCSDWGDLLSPGRWKVKWVRLHTTATGVLTSGCWLLLQLLTVSSWTSSNRYFYRVGKKNVCFFKSLFQSYTEAQRDSNGPCLVTQAWLCRNPATTGAAGTLRNAAARKHAPRDLGWPARVSALH